MINLIQDLIIVASGFFGRQMSLTLVCLLAALAVFHFTPVDIWFQDKLYDFQLHQWWLDRNAHLPKLLLYSGIKKVFIGLAFVLLVSLVFARKKAIIKKNFRGLLIVLLSAIFVPVIIGGLKASTNVPCPKDLQHFGSIYPYVSVFDSYPLSFHQPKRIKCYPAGHASGGFSLLSLFFLFRSRKAKSIALATALGLGWLTGGYKMVIGDHFLSHTVITMILAWLIVLVIARLVYRKRSPEAQAALVAESVPESA